MAHSQDQPCGHCGQASCRLVQTNCRSDVEENRLVLTLHPDVEAVDRHFAFGFLVGDERPAPVGWDQRQDGIAGIGALIREIEARIDLPQHAPREDTEDNMWRLRLAVWPRYRSGLDRVEAEDAILVRRRTAEAHEPGVRPRTIVSWMGVAALRVRLPYFDHGIVDRQAIAIEDPTLNVDLGTRGIRGPQIGTRRFFPVIGFLALFRPPFTAAVRRQAICEERTDGL